MEKEKTWLFIINPASGNGKAKKYWRQIATVLERQKIPYHNVFTKEKLHAIELVNTAVKEGYRKIVAMGGDGTNNEVVNGILLQKTIPSTDIIYTLFPVGTGNDWIRQHRIPKRISKWVAMLQSEQTVLHDIGKVLYHHQGNEQERYFVNVAGMAYDGFVGKALEHHTGKFLRKLLYLYLAVTCLFKYKLTKAKVEFDGQVVEDYFYLINAGICKYSAGGMRTVPHADPSNGKIALTIARNLTKFNVLKSLPLLYNGKIGKHPLITLHQTKHIKVTANKDEPSFLEVDGEFLGQSPVEFFIIENALRVVVLPTT